MKDERYLEGQLFWSTRRAAAHFGVHPNTIRNWVRRSYVAGIFVGMRLYVSKADLDLFAPADLAQPHSHSPAESPAVL